jgi:hypothetical protein
LAWLYVVKNCDLYDFRLEDKRKEYIKNNNITISDLESQNIVINFGLIIKDEKREPIINHVLEYINNYILNNTDNTWYNIQKELLFIYTKDKYQAIIEIPYSIILSFKSTNKKDIDDIWGYIKNSGHKLINN